MLTFSMKDTRTVSINVGVFGVYSDSDIGDAIGVW